MIVAGFCYNGKLKIQNVLIMSKFIHSTISRILETIFKEDIPTLYRNDIFKVDIHMDKASSHMSKSTAAYLAIGSGYVNILMSCV